MGSTINAQVFANAMEKYWQFDTLIDDALKSCEATLLSLLKKRKQFKARSKPSTRRRNMLEIIFTLADFNDDGVLSVRELKAGFEALGRPYWNKGLKSLDKNGDCKINAQEFVTAMENYWQYDTLMDTYLEHCEETLLSLLDKRLHFWSLQNVRPKSPKDGSSERKVDRRRKMLELIFTLTDFNDDGVLSVKELKASFETLGRPYWNKGLQCVDTNGDRKINAPEFVAAMESYWQFDTLMDTYLEHCEETLLALLKKRKQFKERSKKSGGAVVRPKPQPKTDDRSKD